MKKIISFLLLLMIALSACACVPETGKNEYVTPTSSTATARWYDGSEFTPVLRFVAAADTHVDEVYMVDTMKRVENLFIDSYKYARTQEYNKLDAVIFCGDVCEEGAESEYRNLMEAWTKYIEPETRFLCVQAGHELIKGTTDMHKYYTAQESMGMHVELNGFHFITISNSRLDEHGNATNKILDPECDLEWVEDQVETALADGPDKPIFTFMHHPVTDTIIASESTAPEWNEHPVYEDLFKATPNILSFTGHLHTAANHPRAIMQTTFTTLSCGPIFYTSSIADVAGRPFEIQRSNLDSMGSSFLIVEVDANNRIRILPYNLALRQFFTELGSGKEDQQLIRYIDSVVDPSTWLYTQDRWDDDAGDKPHFPASAQVGDIGFTVGKKHYYATSADAGNKNYDDSAINAGTYLYGYYSATEDKYLKDGITLKFAFDSALDNEGVEYYRVKLEDSNGNQKYFFKSDKQGMDEYACIDSRYFMGRTIKTVTINTPVIVGGLTVGETYKITVEAFDTFHRLSSNSITKTFTYNG